MGCSIHPATNQPQNAPFQCHRDDAVEAIILYPSLGMSMVLAPQQKKCSLIIATGADARCRFGVEGDNCKAISAHKYVDRHLRLTPIDGCKFSIVDGKSCVKADTEIGQLYKDPKGFYPNACKAIRVWHLGTVKDGMLIANRHSKVEKGNERREFPIATLVPLLNTEDGPYKDWMRELWEVELELNEQLQTNIGVDEFLNWAWLVKTTDENKQKYAPDNYFTKHDYHEPQDCFIDDYLRKLSNQEGQRHFDADRLFEVMLRDGMEHTPDIYAMPSDTGYANRLQSWHPVIKATKLPLKIGHLSDIHINVQQNVLAKSPACVMEGVTPSPVGKKVEHTFWAVKKLMEKMTSKRNGVDTALLLTGDYINFNRNLTPEAQLYSIGEQWKAFNVLAQVKKKKVSSTSEESTIF